MPVALLAWVSEAGAAEVAVRCERVEASAHEELVARARLLLRADGTEEAVATVAVECDERRSWVRWSNRGAVLTLPIDERQGIVEGALDAIEGMVRRLGQRPERAPELETDDEDRDDVAPPPGGTSARVDREAPGGLGVGVSGEPVRSDAWAIGPRLDVGFGSGAFTGFATEGFRLTTGPSALLIDAQLGAAWGAPFAPNHAFGVAASTGLEWLTAALAGGAASGLTDSSVIFSAGPRGRLRMSGVALWVGLDLKLRAVPQELGSPVALSAPRATVLATVGALFLVAGSSGD